MSETATLDPVQTETIAGVTIDLSKRKTFIFRLSANKKVKAQGRTETGDLDIEYPPKYWIDNPTGGMTTIDPETKRPRRIRCLKGYDEVWVDKQEAQGKLEQTQLQNLREEFLMLDGEIYITLPTDYSKLKYLLLYPSFDKNADANGVPSSFYLVNDDAVAEEELKKETLRTEAEEKVIDLPLNKLKEVASFFGVELKKADGEDRSEGAIRLDLLKKAAERPDALLKSVDSELVRIRHIIAKAVNDAVIDLNKVPGQAHWGDTGGLITVINDTNNPLDALTKFAVGTKKESKDFVKKLGL